MPEQADADNKNRPTFYHGALEKVITAGSQTSTLKRISLGSIVLTYHANTKVWQTEVLVKDNQGSTTAFANADGDAQHRYDPFYLTTTRITPIGTFNTSVSVTLSWEFEYQRNEGFGFVKSIHVIN